MRREEFEEIRDFGELVRVAFDYGHDDLCEYYYSDEGLDDYINDEMQYYFEDYSWTEIRDMLNGIPQGYDWYYVDGLSEVYGISDDDDEFDCLYDNLYEAMIDNNEFEDDEDEESDGSFSPSGWAYEGVHSAEEEEETVEDEEGITLGELISAANSGAQQI